MTSQRYLDNTELQGSNASSTWTVEYEGGIDQSALAHAFELLSAQYPLLRARIRRDDQGYLLYVPPDHRPELTVCDGDESMLHREALLPGDSARGVAKLMVVRGEMRGFVAMRTGGMIIDGTVKMVLFRELWRLYTDVVNGSDVSVHPGEGLPCAPNDLLRRRAGLQLAPSLGSRNTPAPVKLCEAIHRRICLSEEDTMRLVATARAQKISVHAVVCGAILVGLRDQGTPTEPTPMVCWAPVNLRNRVTPPVGATETTSFATRHKAVVTVPANGSPIVVGREVKTQLDTIDTALARGQLRMDPIQSPPARVETSLEQRLATIMVSNMGVIPRFAQPTGLTIIDLHVLGNPNTVMFPVHAVTAYNGRLSIRFDYPADFFTTEEVEQIVKRTTAQLRDIGT